MDLGLAAAAVNAGMKADRDRQVFDYEQKKREAELSLLDAKTAAELSGYQNRQGENEAAMKLRPGATANAVSQQGLTAVDLKAQAGRQGTENQTKDVNASMALSDAQNNQRNQGTRQAIGNNALDMQKLTSDAELKMLPGKLQRAAVQGVLDQQGQSDVVLGTLGALISRNDKPGALRFGNQITKLDGVLPGISGQTLVDIQPVTGGPNGDGYVFVTAEHGSHFVPIKAISGAMDKLKTGQYEHVVGKDGSIGMYDKTRGPGSYQTVHQADPSVIGREHTPAEVQTMEYLLKNKVAKDHAQAWEMVRSAREKTRTGFVSEWLLKNNFMGKSTEDLTKEANDVYDSLHGKDAAVPAAPAAPAGSPGLPAPSGTDWRSWTQ